MHMKIALVADSAGKTLLEVVSAHLNARADVVFTDLSRVGFYADIADRVASSVRADEHERAILFCGTGIGGCIAVNKVPGIRAALTHDAFSAERVAKSSNAEIITMGARVIGPKLAKGIVEVFLASEFDPNGPSAKNVDATGKIDQKYGRSL
jgi:RpiB/LacA/LacB family sugar-phosphate isomerase